MKDETEAPIRFKFYRDSPRQLVVPGYLYKDSDFLPYMKIKVTGFVIPKIDNPDYWRAIGSLVSHNSLVGLNSIVPGLKSQKLRIPESLSRVTYNTFDERVRMHYFTIYRWIS